MSMKLVMTRCGSATLLVLTCLLGARAALSQDKPADAQPVTLTVQAGVPLHVALDKAVPIKHAGIPVEAHVIEPVYIFDHLVIPAGSRIQGRVEKVESASRKQRALAISDGNFTPLRTAHLAFDTLILQDGKRLPLRTQVSAGTPPVIHLTAGGGKRKGRVGTAVDQARQQAKQQEQKAVEAVKAPGKVKRLKAVLVAQLPYHRLSLPVGTHFTAELQAPLELGSEDCPAEELEQLGSDIPPDSTVRVRLLTPLSSATDHRGSSVEAVVSEPVFSSDRHLILPEGARLEGSVTQAVPARRLGRNGQLRFRFQEIQLPQATPRKVEATLQGVEIAGGDHVEVDTEGGAHAVTPKTKYVAPAIDVLLATSSLDGLDPHNHRRIREGLGPQGPDVAGGAVRGGAGFGLVGTVIGLAAHYRPVSASFAFYGAARSVYSHVVARGTDVVFPKNTPMDIRFGTHSDSNPPNAKKKLFSFGGPSWAKPDSA
jgi:hypothetical protein